MYKQTQQPEKHVKRLRALGLTSPSPSSPSYTRARALTATKDRRKNVIEVSGSELETALRSHGDAPVLVNFYAPWCGHCARLAPEYTKAAMLLSDSNAVLLKIDATDRTVSERYGIAGFPTLRLYRNAQLQGDYRGGRSAQAIADHMRAEDRESH